jgi:HAD superfamily hydrolase (TIGR01509 family)
MSKIKAIIFDMDGVLIDAKEWHYEALNLALKDFTCPPITREQHINIFDGLPTKRKLEKLYAVQKQPAPELHAKIDKRKQTYTIEQARQKCQPVPWQQECLRQLKAEKYRLACCSNSIYSTVELFLQLADVRRYLEFFLSNQCVSKPKPHPEIYLKAIEKLKLDPAEVLICEDNPHGLAAATASGAHVLKINSILDVNYENIKRKILTIEKTAEINSFSYAAAERLVKII